MEINIAVMYFPGNNCEEETKIAVESAGMKATIVRWNEPEKLVGFDGYVLVGGWSYEDRIRAGVIAAKDPVMKFIKKEAADGKVVLGICNGCQMLVESGMIPGLKDEVEMALAPNENPLISGFYCTWVNIKVTSSKHNAFTNVLKKEDVLRIPIAHGEGRFTTSDESLLKKLIRNDQILFRYCTPEGVIEDSFPTNPNGSVYNIAGICNKEGNVLGMMPHPERANFARQVPGPKKDWSLPGPGRAIFESMKNFIEQRQEEL